MAANQTIEIRLILRDELSRQLAPVISQLRQLNNARVDNAHAGMTRLGGAVRLVHREFSSFARITFGGIVGGGVVAGIFSAAKALGDMARQGMQLRYTAEQLGVAPQFLEQMSDGLTALGMTADQAASSVEHAITALREGEVEGKQSSLFRALEKGVHGSGLRLWREIQQQMAGPEGAEGAFKFLITRMQGMMPSGQRALMKALGLSSLAFKDLKEVLPQLQKRVQLSREDMMRLNVANANFEISMGNVGRMLGAAVMPGLAKVTKALSDYLQTENGKKFAAELREWSDSVGEAIAKWIREGGLKREIDGIKQAVEELKAAFDTANVVITAIGTEWEEFIDGIVNTPFVKWLTDVARALGLINEDDLEGKVTLLEWAARLIEQLLGNKRTRQQELEEGEQTVPVPPSLAPPIRRVPQGVPRPEPQSGQGLPKTEQERRAEMQEEKRQREALNSEFKTLAYDLSKLNDYIMPGGPEGGGGTSGYQLGGGDGTTINMPVLGPAGGGKTNRPYPTLPSQATPLSAIPGTVRPAQSAGTGFASWYGNLPNLGFVDPEDKGRKGVREEDQGIALGPTETRGQYHYLTDPFTGLTHVTRQTDTGPNIRTQKLLDIHAAQLNRMGYTKNTFKSGVGLWNVSPAGFGQPGQEAAWAGRSGGFDELGGVGGAAPPSTFDEAGFSGITNALASQNAASLSGSATVDIDVGGLGTPERNPNDLFRPQPIEGNVQMQNPGHVPNNPLSFQ